MVKFRCVNKTNKWCVFVERFQMTLFTSVSMCSRFSVDLPGFIDVEWINLNYSMCTQACQTADKDASRQESQIRERSPIAAARNKKGVWWAFHNVNCETFHDVSMEVTVDCMRFRGAVLLPWWIAPVVLSTHETMLICINTLLMFNGSPLKCVKAEDYHLRFLCFENLSRPSSSLWTEITCERSWNKRTSYVLAAREAHVPPFQPGPEKRHLPRPCSSDLWAPVRPGSVSSMIKWVSSKLRMNYWLDCFLWSWYESL